MPLPPNQITVLRYLGKHQPATVRNAVRDLGLNRQAVRKALIGLAGGGLVSADHGTWPVSYSVTDIGSALLAAANFGRES